MGHSSPVAKKRKREVNLQNDKTKNAVAEMFDLCLTPLDNLPGLLAKTPEVPPGFRWQKFRWKRLNEKKNWCFFLGGVVFFFEGSGFRA